MVSENMETFTEPKEQVADPGYEERRRDSLAGLTENMIDKPIRGLVKDINDLPHCYTLQSCFGHFLYTGQNDAHNFEPLPRTDDIGQVEYRIAYIALCIENSLAGRSLITSLKNMQEPGWFRNYAPELLEG